MCPDCQKLYDGWLMTPFRPKGWVVLNNEERSLENYKTQHEQHRELVKHHLVVIRDFCRRNHA